MHRILMSLALLAPIGAGLAQAVPGSDPIQLERVEPLDPGGAGAPPPPPGNGISGADGARIAPGADARLVRFQAKIMTLQNQIDDALAQAATNATVTTAIDPARKICVMDIGSNTQHGSGFDTYGPKGDANQPVLIRGTVLNICR